MIMPVLEPMTVVVTTGFIAVMMTMVFIFFRRGCPPSVKAGLTEWAAAPVVLIVSTLLIAGRGTLPDLLSYVAANLMFMAGSLLFTCGTLRFFGGAPTRRLWAAFLGPAALWLVTFSVVMPNFAAMVIGSNFFISLIFIYHSWLLLRQRSPLFSTRFVMALMIVQAVMFSGRFVLQLIDPETYILASVTILQSVFASVLGISLIMQIVGLLLMATDKLRRELEHLADHDALTGALNRRSFMEYCSDELDRCHRHERTMILLMMDLDHFKRVNDTYGHLAGDKVIIDFTSRVTSLLRRVDRLGRYGGEEFVVLLPETTPAMAAIVAERIRQTAATAADVTPYTVSIGLAASNKADRSVHEILERADAALYRAKEAGRNRIELAE